MARKVERDDDAVSVEHLERQFSRMSIARRDFVEAEEFLSARTSDHSAVVESALLVAATISYCRPFKRSNTGGMSTASLPQSALRALSIEHRALHSHLIALRDEAVAHASFARRAALRIQVGVGNSYVATAERRFDIRKHIDSPDTFLDLVRTLILYTNQEVFRLDEALRHASAT